jgi:hypothetical protein
MSYSLSDSFFLSKKKFFRAPQWELKLAVRILIGFLVLYFLAAFLLLGVGLFFIVKENDPNQDPIFAINSFLLYYLGVEFLIRFFFQNTPMVEVKPLLMQPVPKKKIVRGVSFRSLGALYNFISIVILTPFCIVFSIKGGDLLSIWTWLLGVVCLSLSNNFIIFLVNKNRKVALGVLTTLVLGVLLEKGLQIDVISLFSRGFDALYQNPIWVSIPFSLLIISFSLMERYLLKQLYLDKGLEQKSERILGTELSFLDALGSTSLFIKNDIRMIIRNVRPRQVVLMGIFFLPYGLIFFANDLYSDQPVWLIFAGIFVSGGFMLTFGQFVPAWDSEYFSFLMCQNISYKKYLKSKLFLLMFGVLVSSILCIPYIYFGTRIFLVVMAAALFNFGLGSMITLFSGAYNATPVKLNVKAKAFENTQNFSFTQLLFTLPKMVLPLIAFYIPYYFFSFNAGLIGLASMGLLGLIFQKQLINAIEKIYQNKKHETIQSFNKS